MGRRVRLTLAELRQCIREHCNDLARQERFGGPSALGPFSRKLYYSGSSAWMKAALMQAPTRRAPRRWLEARLGEHLHALHAHNPRSYLVELMAACTGWRP